MRLFYQLRFKNLAIPSLFVVATSGYAADSVMQPNEDEWKFTLKNAYINRDYENPAIKDAGSWSQSASLFYTSKMRDTPLEIADKPLTIGVDASVQYAVRLSNDRHVADTVLPFDTQTKS
ncbi:outer membrane porin, OprD family, partial [Acinetobacter sp. ANC 4635]